MDRYPNQLSGGQQQRVSIARAIAAKPAVLLADEPTGNLDSKTSAEVMGLLKMTSREFHQTIIMITHNEAIAQLADRVIHLEDGRIVRDDGEAYIRENEQGQVAGIGQSASGKEASL
jgi:putative ABC transport system ATP-binding protein